MNLTFERLVSKARMHAADKACLEYMMQETSYDCNDGDHVICME